MFIHDHQNELQKNCRLPTLRILEYLLDCLCWGKRCVLTLNSAMCTWLESEISWSLCSSWWSPWGRQWCRLSHLNCLCRSSSSASPSKQDNIWHVYNTSQWSKIWNLCSINTHSGHQNTAKWYCHYAFSG